MENKKHIMTKHSKSKRYNETLEYLKQKKASGTLNKLGEFILSGQNYGKIKDLRAVLK